MYYKWYVQLTAHDNYVMLQQIELVTGMLALAQVYEPVLGLCGIMQGWWSPDLRSFILWAVYICIINLLLSPQWLAV